MSSNNILTERFAQHAIVPGKGTELLAAKKRHYGPVFKGSSAK